MLRTEPYEDDDLMAALTNLSKEETGLHSPLSYGSPYADRPNVSRR